MPDFIDGEHCMVCGKPIVMIVQRGTDYCSQQCEDDDKDKVVIDAFPISQNETCEDLRDVQY